MPTATTNRLSDEGTRVSRVAAGQSRQVAGEATEQARDLKATAAEHAGEIVQATKQHARQVMETVRSQPGDVSQQVSTEARSLVAETRTQLETQARAGTQRVAGAFRQLGEQAQALAEGRPDEAPALTEYVWRAADRCYGAADRIHALAEDVEGRGFTGVVDDLQSFARRRPGTFLLGALAVGFGVGRLLKAEQEEQEQDEIEEAPPGNARTAVAARPARTQAVR